MRRFVRNERRLQFSLVVAIGLLFLALVIRAWVLNSTDEKLCSVIHDQIARSGALVGKPGQPGYAYFQAHPAELQKTKDQNKQFLDRLPCK